MTIQQLLDWLLRADYLHRDSWNHSTRKYDVCEVQSLKTTAPVLNTHGYSANAGELQLATALMFTCSRTEMAEMADECWINTPIETGLGHAALDATPVPGVDPMPVVDAGIITYETYWQHTNNVNATDMHREITEMLAALPLPQANDEA